MLTSVALSTMSAEYDLTSSCLRRIITMSLSSEEAEHPAAVQAWSFDESQIVPGHLAARSCERRVLIGCALVGLVGVGILLAVIVGGVPDTTATVLQG